MAKRKKKISKSRGLEKRRRGILKLLLESQRLPKFKKPKPKLPHRIPELKQPSNTDLQKLLAMMELKKAEARQFARQKNEELSPNTEMMLRRVMQTQNKAFVDNERQQRLHRERRILESQTNLLKTPNLFKESECNLDATGITPDNILLASNTFLENRDEHILKPRRFNILNCKEAGNNLF